MGGISLDLQTSQTWDAQSGAVLDNPLVGHNSFVAPVARSSDGRYIISGHVTGPIGHKERLALQLAIF